VSVTSLDPRKFAERLPRWLVPQGPDSDVVISCRVRLARNVEGFPFVSKLSDERAVELCQRVQATLCSPELAEAARPADAPPGSEEMLWVEVGDATPLVRLLLRERHLVSRDLAPIPEERPSLPGRAVAFSSAETVSVMVNEEDHLRLQAMTPGFELERAWERATAVERVLEQRIQPAFDREVGYLTCCPTNVGTGLRASVMLHLPALGMVRTEIEKVFAAAQRTGLAVRGLYGEGSRAFGDFYQVSNQVTLGRSEEQLVAELAELVPAVVRYERTLRESLMAERRAALVDRVSRSYGLLRTARAMPTDGALAHLSSLRLGLHLGLWKELPAEELARARVQIQKGHVQALSQDPVEAELIDPSERDRLRAASLRRLLAPR
jgi:protein arginine kinase